MVNREKNWLIWSGVWSSLERVSEITSSGRIARHAKSKSVFDIEEKSSSYRLYVLVIDLNFLQTLRNERRIVSPSMWSRIRWKISTGSDWTDGELYIIVSDVFLFGTCSYILARRLFNCKMNSHFYLFLHFQTKNSQSNWRRRYNNVECSHVS
jgi:hypothetical protein